MIPAITPPTDNLYKFVSLFGLAIFLFAMYNISIVYDECVKDKMKIEDLKIEVAVKYYEKNGNIYTDLKKQKQKDANYRRLLINDLDEDINTLRSLIFDSKFSDIDELTFIMKANKVKVSLDNLRTKRRFGYLTIGIGIFGMIIGFFLWKKKDQDLRDKILELEHFIKQNERDERKSKWQNIPSNPATQIPANN